MISGELVGWHTPVIPSLQGEAEAGGSLPELGQPELYSKILSQTKMETIKQMEKHWGQGMVKVLLRLTQAGQRVLCH